MLENGGNFENNIPIPDYQIHLVLDRISSLKELKQYVGIARGRDLEKE